MRLRILVLAAAALLSVASLSAKTSYRPLTQTPPAPRNTGCLYDVLWTRPAPGSYTEIGLFTVANPSTNAVKTDQQLRDLLGTQVCEKGGDGVYAEKDPSGNVFRATVVRYATAPVRRAPEAARCEPAGRYAMSIDGRTGNCAQEISVSAATVVLGRGPAAGAAPVVQELSAAPFGPMMGGYVSSWDPTGCQITVKASQASTAANPYEAQVTLVLRPGTAGEATGEGTLTFSGGPRAGGGTIPACAESFQLRGIYNP